MTDRGEAARDDISREFLNLEIESVLQVGI